MKIELSPGETYVAYIQIAGLTPYHLILLPDHPQDEMTHEEATAWASSVGGDLPTRPEQALLLAYQKNQFDHDWYWSNTRNELDSNYAWYQGFNYGTQHSYDRGLKLRARAVRRVENQ